MVNIFQNVPPLDWQTPIVNQDGTPSAQFIRIWKYAIENTDYTIDGLDGKVNKAGDTMTGALRIDTGMGAVPSGISGVLALLNANGLGSLIETQGFGAGGGFIARRANGTRSAPSFIANGNSIGAFTTQGWNGVSWSIATNINAMADENWSSTARGSRITFSGVNIGSTALTEWVRLSNGNLQMGGSNTVITNDRHLQLRSYTTSGLPSASGRTGQLVYVSDASAGQQFKFSNGSSWVAPSGGGSGGLGTLLPFTNCDMTTNSAVVSIPGLILVPCVALDATPVNAINFPARSVLAGQTIVPVIYDAGNPISATPNATGATLVAQGSPVSVGTANRVYSCALTSAFAPTPGNWYYVGFSVYGAAGNITLATMGSNIRYCFNAGTHNPPPASAPAMTFGNGANYPVWTS